MTISIFSKQVKIKKKSIYSHYYTKLKELLTNHQPRKVYYKWSQEWQPRNTITCNCKVEDHKLKANKNIYKTNTKSKRTTHTHTHTYTHTHTHTYIYILRGWGLGEVRGLIAPSQPHLHPCVKYIYTKLTFCNHLNKNIEHPNLRITKIWVQ